MKLNHHPLTHRLVFTYHLSIQINGVKIQGKHHHWEFVVKQFHALTTHEA